MKLPFALLSVLTMSLLAACTPNTDPALLSRLEELERKNEELTKVVDNIRIEAAYEKLEKLAYMKPGDTGYRIVRFDLGHLAVSLEDIQAYANGSRITVKLGNLTTARVNGLKAKVDWGKVDSAGLPMQETKRNREIEFSESLDAGAWTTVQMVLDGVPPTDLGYVRLTEVGHRAIALRR